MIILKLLNLLSPPEKNGHFLVINDSVIAMLEMIGVVSIMPFMAVLMNPDLIDTNNLLNAFFNSSNIFDIETKEQFLFFLGIIVFLLLVVSLTFKFLTFYIQLRFTSTLNYSLAKRLVEGYLHQPYSWFLNRHSADLGKTILSEVSVVLSLSLNPMLNLIRQSVVAFVLIIMLIFVDTKLTLILGLPRRCIWTNLCIYSRIRCEDWL